MATFCRAALAWLVLAAATTAAAATIRASTPEVRKQVVTVIEEQLSAFRKGEIEKAYALAAAELRAQKPLRVFAGIVQGSYPEIWKNTRGEFGIVRDDGTQATVTVQVYSKDDHAAYDFTLRKERSGWRIYGVVRHESKKAEKV